MMRYLLILTVGCFFHQSHAALRQAKKERRQGKKEETAQVIRDILATQQCNTPLNQQQYEAYKQLEAQFKKEQKLPLASANFNAYLYRRLHSATDLQLTAAEWEQRITVLTQNQQEAKLS